LKKWNLFLHLHKNCLNILFFIILFSCAAISPPSGGPEDEIPPKLISSFPESGALLFRGNKIELKFSEYIDESSIANAFNISPQLDDGMKVIYDNKEILIELPDDLLEGQTYVISISSKLKDERGVFFEKTEQIAFSTGSTIDNGKINGKVYGEGYYSVHLWKIKEELNDSLFFTKPLYVSDADQNGNFNFNYLSKGKYAILGIERSASGATLNTSRMAYGLSPQLEYILTEDKLMISDIYIKTSRKEPAFNIDYIDWKANRWGNVFFNQGFDNINFEEIFIISEKGKKNYVNYYQSNVKKNEFLIISNDELEPGKNELIIKNINSNGKMLTNEIKISLIVSNDQDIEPLSILDPSSKITIKPDGVYGPLIPFLFSKPLISFGDSAFFLINENDTSLIYPDLITPQQISIFPKGGWKEKNSYQVKILSNQINTIDGQSFLDSLIFIEIDSGKKLGYGSLAGKLDNSISRKINPIIGLNRMEIDSIIYFEKLNGNSRFEIENILEGKYKILVISDADSNNNFTGGSFFPLKASEWFYEYPDTFQIRANWELDVGQIEKE
tara:strand:+ start:176 stop:1849 length:1674 start_codon:yes stop_codon:yes gene_type:complete